MGVSAVDLKTGKSLVAHRAAEPLTPASNQKLLTSAFALQRLGGGFRFVTGVFLLGDDLVVVGDGDPTLGDPHLAAAAGTTIYADLDRWAAAAAKQTGGRIRDVLLCTRPDEPGRPTTWPDNQRRAWYCAPVSTLNFHNNCFDVTFVRAGSGLAPVVAPWGRYFRLDSRLTVGSEHIWSLRTADGGATVVLTGTISGEAEKPLSAAVDDPAMLLGRTFADRLARAGAAPTGKVRKVTAARVQWSAARPVAHTATSLPTAMRRANKRSLNMAAEAIFLRAGDGTWKGSAEMMTQTLTKSFGLAAGSFTVVDGSGMSRANRIAPAAMTQLLAALVRRHDAMVLLTSLPIGGVDGTLAERFARGPCRTRVIAKTGTLSGASALSGYLLGPDRRCRIAFAVLVNRIPARLGTAGAKRLQDDVCRILLESIDAETN